MTTTPELHELAKDPQAFDTALARLHDALAKTQDLFHTIVGHIHREAGDRKVYDRATGRSHWSMPLTSCLELVSESRRDDRLSVLAAIEAILAQVNEMDEVYAEYRWTRFFPSITKSQPHIHRSLSCSTLYPTTQMSWAPQLSGRTDDEAVAELDEALCSVCFPDAPVALHNYVSRRSQAEQDARQAEKDERAAKLAAKQLTEAEQFRTVGHFGDRVTTVAKCKELVRKAPQAMAELEWTRAHGSRVWTDPADLARVIRNREDNLADAETNAAAATDVLVSREARQEGYGATEADITRMHHTALKNARKEWAKN